MNLFLILFVIGVSFVFIGYANQLKNNAIDIDNKKNTIIKYVPRPVYDDLVMSNTLF
jgi:hypothetical protein